ncbi:MAG: ParA family protein [Actinobacteria bacterium]|nr:ParA family protein [Actinomycetota bacterium]
MNKVVFFNTKGGTGKTTICFNYGWYLAKNRNKKVLFLDFDPQISLVQAFFAKSSIPKNRCLENLVVNHLKGQGIDFGDYIIRINENIDLLPSSNNISLLEEYLTDYLLDRTFYENKIYQSSDRNVVIKEVLEQYINPEKYDYILIDSQPNYSLLSTTSIIFARNIILVLRPEIFSFLDVKYLTKIINNLEEKFRVDINVAGVLINAYERRKKASESIASKFRHRYGEEFNLVGQKIRYLSHYQLSILLNREPVFMSFPSSEASLDLLAAFGELDSLIDKTIDESVPVEK